MIVLEECEDSDWIEREVYWIAEYRQAENDLINISDGGEGHNCEASRTAWIRSFAKTHKVPLTNCFVCGGVTVSSVGICTKCLREIDENYQESDWYKFLFHDHKKTREIEKRDEKRLVPLKCIKRGLE